MFPIILVHGIARFDILLELHRERFNLDDGFLDEIHYFKGIKTYLESHGFDPVFHSNQDFAGSVEVRSEQLKNRVEEILSATGARKAHVIAHSMGGLDARHMIVDKNMADKVASLTTIGTPHLGTGLADHIIGKGGKLWLEILGKAVEFSLEGFNDLTIEACESFNRRAENEESGNEVFYQTYASYQELNSMFLPLIPSWGFIKNSEGSNDGLVSFKSQQWKSELVAADGRRKIIVQKEFPLPADHLNQIGWWDFEESINPLIGGRFSSQKKSFEKKIKDVYLEIATNLQSDIFN